VFVCVGVEGGGGLLNSVGLGWCPLTGSMNRRKISRQVTFLTASRNLPWSIDPITYYLLTYSMVQSPS